MDIRFLIIERMCVYKFVFKIFEILEIWILINICLKLCIICLESEVIDIDLKCKVDKISWIYIKRIVR